MIKAGIINITGYVGMELARFLFHHPQVKLATATARTSAGKRLGDVLPHLGDIDLIITAEPEGEVDILFSALPHKASAEAVIGALNQGIRIIDLSADFRLKDPSEYELWYEVKHPAPELLKQAVYGLTELKREKIKGAKLVANPGCYPTAVILALAPLVKENLIEPDIIIDAKSGISGAGRTLSLETHFSEVNEDVSAYSLRGHRHLPEIVQELKEINPQFSPSITFLPHLVPMTRGILCTCYAKPTAPIKKKELMGFYRDFYKGERFIRIVDFSPHTKYTWGNNFCLIHPTIDERTGRVIILSCLDNLVKGAGGQAIQNMNIMLGFPEGMGLETIAIFP